MSDSHNELDKAIERFREQNEQQRKAAEAQRDQQIALQRARQEAIEAAHSIAERFKDVCIDPPVERIASAHPDWFYGQIVEERALGRRFRSGPDDWVELRLDYDEEGIWLTAEASRAGAGPVYTKTSDKWAVSEFDEAVGKQWMDAHAHKAYEAAFGRRA